MHSIIDSRRDRQTDNVIMPIDVESGIEGRRRIALKHIGRTLFLFTAAIRIATWSTVNKQMTTAGDITRASLNSSLPLFQKGDGCGLPAVLPR